MPKLSQIDLAYGILVEDFSHDGNLDVLLSGNNFGTEVESGRYDASPGILLQCNGKGDFSPVDPAHTGPVIDQNSRGAVSIQVKDETVYLFVQNSDLPQAYKLNDSRKGKRLIAIPNYDLKAKVYYDDSTYRMKEFYYGSSYLSQSSR